MDVTPAQARRFRATVYGYFRKHRRDFPWRHTTDPYRIMVSEVMLQQTQTDRVVGKYRLFLKRFPTVGSLARARTRDVLAAWQGLGYNRRAVALQNAARVIVELHNNRVPSDSGPLNALPGIGPYTAAAVSAFAFDRPAVMLETNIRTVLIHHFFPKRKIVHDRELIPIMETVLDRKNPRTWYSALMDYGASLKKRLPNPGRRSAHYTPQKKFAGSNRQVRGAVVRLLLERPLTAAQLRLKLPFGVAMLPSVLRKLVQERLIGKRSDRYRIV